MVRIEIPAEAWIDFPDGDGYYAIGYEGSVPFIVTSLVYLETMDAYWTDRGPVSVMYERDGEYRFARVQLSTIPAAQGEKESSK